ncbi:hypothetical protein [Leptolyngbya phage Lsp-JY19]
MTGTDFIHFDRTGDGQWRLRTQLSTHEVKVQVEMAFTRDPLGPVWPAERRAIQKAHEALGELLKHLPGPAEPSGPGA